MIPSYHVDIASAFMQLMNDKESLSRHDLGEKIVQLIAGCVNKAHRQHLLDVPIQVNPPPAPARRLPQISDELFARLEKMLEQTFVFGQHDLDAGAFFARSIQDYLETRIGNAEVAVKRQRDTTLYLKLAAQALRAASCNFANE